TIAPSKMAQPRARNRPPPCCARKRRGDAATRRRGEERTARRRIHLSPRRRVAASPLRPFTASPRRLHKRMAPLVGCGDERSHCWVLLFLRSGPLGVSTCANVTVAARRLIESAPLPSVCPSSPPSSLNFLMEAMALVLHLMHFVAERN